MIHLMIMMLERVGIIVILGFILAHTKLFRQALQNQDGYKGKAILISIFSLFSIISNYTGIEIQRNMIVNNDWVFTIDPSGSIANTRILGVEIGGLLGGPFVGAGIGILAGGPASFFTRWQHGLKLCRLIYFSGCSCRLDRQVFYEAISNADTAHRRSCGNRHGVTANDHYFADGKAVQ